MARIGLHRHVRSITSGLALAGLVAPAMVLAAEPPGATVDGTYELSESDVQGQACPATPFRVALAPGTTPGSGGIVYKVSVTASSTAVGGQITFAPETGGPEIFTAPLTEVTEEPFRARFRASRAQAEPGGYLEVDGEFTENLDDMLLAIEWWRETSPGNGDLCRTDIGGRRVQAAGVAGPPPSSGGGGPPVVVLLAAAGAAVVLLGGVTVYRRSRPKDGPSAPATVPPPCVGFAKILDDHVATLEAIRGAEADLRTKLERAERVHANNLIKARLVINLEIGAVVLGSATDLALALRPAALRRVGPDAIGQRDRWKPPTRISSRLASAIEQAQAAASAALAKLRTLTDDAARLAAEVEQKVADSPLVKRLQGEAEYFRNVLRDLEAALPEAESIRKRMAELVAEREPIPAQRQSLHDQIGPLRDRIGELQAQANMARNRVDLVDPVLSNQLKKAEAELASLEASGVEDTLRLSTAESQVQSLRARMERARSTPEVKAALAEAEQLEGLLAVERRNHDALETMRAGLESRSTQLDAEHQKLVAKLTQVGDVYITDIDYQKRAVGHAEQAVHDAIAEARTKSGGELAARQEQVRQAQVEAAAAQGLLDDLLAQAERRARGGADAPTEGSRASAVGTAIGWATAPIRYSLTIVGEIVLGVGQSPKEIWAILVRGQTNIQILRDQLASIRGAAATQEGKVQVARQQLDACVRSVAGARSDRSGTVPRGA